MRARRVAVVLAALALLSIRSVRAQSTTATISGRVTDSQNLPVPGVTVSVQSPSLQGVQAVVTSDNGDYILTGLPSGVYRITFELSGFETQSRVETLAPTQVRPLNVEMGPAGLTERVDVVGGNANVLTQTAQAATNFPQELIALLPTTRDVGASVLMAPAVHPTGPVGAFSIAGAMSYENLFLINGVTVNENLRGQPNVLFIEEAIQETTVATSGVSAEYGRFIGGVVNVITKSGGNEFSGSFRDTLFNDDWRALTDFGGDTKIDALVPTHEYTLGGPVLRDKLWFFTAGRFQDQSQARQTVVLNIPYIFEINSKRYEGKATFSLNASHRVQGSFTKIQQEEVNQTGNSIMDLNSLVTRQTPQDLFTLSYNGILRSNLFVETRYSRRNSTTTGSGATATDRINGTLILDQSRGQARYWSPTFCGVCTPEERDNQDFFFKGSYFLSTASSGSHNVVFGYNTFDDRRLANARQSGSDYRIYGTSAILRNGTVYPQFIGTDDTTTIMWNPIDVLSQGTSFRTHSLFANDSWRANANLTFNLGLRWDKNDGRDSGGRAVAKDSAFSPRLGVVWDPRGDGTWAITASASRYVAALNNGIANAASPGGNPATITWPYRGPSINPDPSAPLTSTPDALRQVFAWFDANDIAATQPVAATIPGVSTVIGDGLVSPNVVEYGAGVSRQVGASLVMRADYTFRDYRDFYAGRIDASTGRVTNPYGFPADLQVFENSNKATRRYSGATVSAAYRLGTRLNAGANYTLSRLWGNFDGENGASGAQIVDFDQYPEFKQLSWYAPDGDLSADQRHRARAWASFVPPGLEGLNLSVLHDYGSGVPYGAAPLQGVNNSRLPTSVPYVTPQGAQSLTYYFTDRDAFRTESNVRTDLSATYTYALRAGNRRVELFVQGYLINAFNVQRLCGCGGDVFQNGGTVTLAGPPARIDQTVFTNVNRPALYQAFNPFTDTPVEGVHWAKGPNFGTALNRFAYTSPRAFRMAFGVRF